MLLTIEKAIQSALTSGTAGNAVNDRVYNTLAPVDAVMPFIVVIFESGGERMLAQRKVFDVRYTIKAVSLNAAQVKPIAPMIRADLHEQPLTLDNPYKLTRVQHLAWINTSEFIERQLYFVAGGVYRFRFTEAL